MKYAYIMLYAEHVPKMIEFCVKALRFNKKFIKPENDYGELFTGE